VKPQQPARGKEEDEDFNSSLGPISPLAGTIGAHRGARKKLAEERK